MARAPESAADSSIVSRDRVIDIVRRELRTAIFVEKRFSDLKAVADAAGLESRAVRTYMANDPTERREPCASALLSLAVVLGPRCVNAVLALIGYGGAEPLDEPDNLEPMALVGEMMGNVAIIAQAAARGKSRIQHTDEPAVRHAADELVAEALKFSSIGDAE